MTTRVSDIFIPRINKRSHLNKSDFLEILIYQRAKTAFHSAADLADWHLKKMLPRRYMEVTIIFALVESSRHSTAFNTTNSTKKNYQAQLDLSTVIFSI